MPLEVRQVSYNYKPDGPLALSQVTASFAPGERVVIAGANGSGKSTLLKVLSGLYSPWRGEVQVDGYQVKTAKGQLLPGVGMVVANPERYFFAATVEEELAYSLHSLKLPEKVKAEQRAAALEAVGLNAGFLPRNPFFLSLGEQRKVGIASILILQPRYLLLDEPLSNLDEPGVQNLLQYLDSYAAGGRAVIISSHRSQELVAWGQRLLVLETGRIHYDGPMQDWQRQPDRPLMLGEAAYLRYLLAQKGIDIGYTTDPEVMAESIRQAVVSRGRFS